MKVNQLHYYITLVDSKSYTKAAEKLFISQSTISKAVRCLEEELQTTLVNPYGSKEFITESGQIFYRYAIEIVRYLEDQKQALFAELEKTDNQVKLGLPPTSGSMYFFSLISKFSRMYPDIRLDISDVTSKYIPDLLLTGQLQLGIVVEPFDDAHFEKIIAIESEAVLTVSDQHPLAGSVSVDFSTLKDEKFLQISPEFMYYGVFLDYCKQAGFTPNIIFESDQWDMILEMVANNEGVTVLPMPLVQKFFPNRIRTIHLENPQFYWGLSLIYPKNKVLSKPMIRFIDLVRESHENIS